MVYECTVEPLHKDHLFGRSYIRGGLSRGVKKNDWLLQIKYHWKTFWVLCHSLFEMFMRFTLLGLCRTTKAPAFAYMPAACPSTSPQWAHDAIITSLWRQNNVATSFSSLNGISFTLCVHWVLYINTGTWTRAVITGSIYHEILIVYILPYIVTILMYSILCYIGLCYNDAYMSDSIRGHCQIWSSLFPADVIAPNGVRPSADTVVMEK